jgi:hypothetical protein
MVNEKINETKQKMLDWLKEEAFSAEEKADPNAFFNIQATRNNMGVNIIQTIPRDDSFFIVANIITAEEEQTFLKGMGSEKRLDFIWDLQMNLLKNNELGDFAFKPKAPEEIQIITITSRAIFYDELTKAKLHFTIHVVLKAMVMTMWMLQKYAGIALPKINQKKQDYSM